MLVGLQIYFLATLNGRGEIGKVEATDINTGGRKTYYYFAKGKLPT